MVDRIHAPTPMGSVRKIVLLIGRYVKASCDSIIQAMPTQIHGCHICMPKNPGEIVDPKDHIAGSANGAE